MEKTIKNIIVSGLTAAIFAIAIAPSSVQARPIEEIRKMQKKNEEKKKKTEKLTPKQEQPQQQQKAPVKKEYPRVPYTHPYPRVPYTHPAPVVKKSSQARSKRKKQRRNRRRLKREQSPVANNPIPQAPSLDEYNQREQERERTETIENISIDEVATECLNNMIVAPESARHLCRKHLDLANNDKFKNGKEQLVKVILELLADHLEYNVRCGGGEINLACAQDCVEGVLVCLILGIEHPSCRNIKLCENAQRERLVIREQIDEAMLTDCELSQDETEKIIRNIVESYFKNNYPGLSARLTELYRRDDAKRTFTHKPCDRQLVLVRKKGPKSAPKHQKKVIDMENCAPKAPGRPEKTYRRRKKKAPVQDNPIPQAPSLDDYHDIKKRERIVAAPAPVVEGPVQETAPEAAPEDNPQPNPAPWYRQGGNYNPINWFLN